MQADDQTYGSASLARTEMERVMPEQYWITLTSATLDESPTVLDDVIHFAFDTLDVSTLHIRVIPTT